MLQPVLERLEIGVGHRLIVGDREEQRDVDVEPLPHRLERRGDALGRAGDLDHDVGAVHGGEQALCLGDGRRGVVGKRRRHFDGDEAILAAAAHVDRTEHVAGGAHVVHGEPVQDSGRAEALPGQLEDLLVVGLARGNGLLEDGRVSGHAAQRVAVHHPPEAAARHELAVDVVEPGALAEPVQLRQPGSSGHRDHAPCASFALARASSLTWAAWPTASRFPAAALFKDGRASPPVLNSRPRRERCR